MRTRPCAAARSSVRSCERLRRACGERRSRAARLVAQHADRRAANPFESVLRALARSRGFDAHATAGGQRDPGSIAVVDLGSEDLMLAVEADGFEHHGTRRALRKDCRRHTELAVFGWSTSSSPSRTSCTSRPGSLGDAVLACGAGRWHPQTPPSGCRVTDPEPAPGGAHQRAVPPTQAAAPTVATAGAAASGIHCLLAGRPPLAHPGPAGAPGERRGQGSTVRSTSVAVARRDELREHPGDPRPVGEEGGGVAERGELLERDDGGRQHPHLTRRVPVEQVARHAPTHCGRTRSSCRVASWPGGIPAARIHVS